jgi:hypothetical protein
MPRDKHFFFMAFSTLIKSTLDDKYAQRHSEAHVLRFHISHLPQCALRLSLQTPQEAMNGSKLTLIQ